MPDPIALDGQAVEAALAVPDSRSRSFPVEHEGELLGTLTVTVSPAEPLTPAREKLIADLAAQTGLGLRFEQMKERALFARALASFLPPEVAELVEASPSALSLREEVEATILFSDIRGFSTLAERLPPREVAEVVGRHLAAMAEVVTAHGGVLDKFAGDAVNPSGLRDAASSSNCFSHLPTLVALPDKPSEYTCRLRTQMITIARTSRLAAGSGRNGTMQTT